MMKKLIIICTAALFLWSCNDDFSPNVDDAVVSAGDADFYKFVAVGNSLTAGYMDGALYSSGQMNSFPKIMHDQMSLAQEGPFTQPLMPDDIGGFADFGIDGKLQLLVVNDTLTPVPTMAVANFSPIPALYSNSGVPGAKTFHLLAPGYGNPAGIPAGLANPYFVRMTTDPDATVLSQVMQQQPTFFSLWIGNNDVLAYATSGGLGLNQTGNPNPFTYGFNDISDPALVENVYNALLTNLVTNAGAKGVVANIPYVTSIPFFTTVPYNALAPDALGGAAQIDQLNAQLYGPLSQILTAFGQGSRIMPLSTTSPNPLLIVDESLTDLSAQITAAASASGNPTLVALAPVLGAVYGQARQATDEDLILLTTAGVIGGSNANAGVPAPLDIWGVTFPLADQHVLTSAEAAECTVATDAYNNIISNLADTYDLAFFDANEAMMDLSGNSGFIYNGVSYNADYVTGGAFSLDGVHPNGRGYAIIANGFLKAINLKYGSTLPMVNPNDYPGVTFPN